MRYEEREEYSTCTQRDEHEMVSSRPRPAHTTHHWFGGMGCDGMRWGWPMSWWSRGTLTNRCPSQLPSFPPSAPSLSNFLRTEYSVCVPGGRFPGGGWPRLAWCLDVMPPENRPTPLKEPKEPNINEGPRAELT